MQKKGKQVFIGKTTKLYIGAEVKKKSICHSKLVFRREKSIGSDGPRFESPWFGI